MPLPRSSIARFGNIERPLRGALMHIRRASVNLDKAMRAKQQPNHLVVLQAVRAECTRVEVLTQEMIGRLYDAVGTGPAKPPRPSLLPARMVQTKAQQEALRAAFEKYEAGLAEKNQPKE